MVFTHDVKGNEYFIEHLKNNKINFIFQNINSMEKEISEFSPDYIISVYYRYILSDNILKIVNYKAINLHPSLLPKYRGTKSSVWAIINNEKYTGISFHYMNKNIDDGRLLFQKKLKILPEDTAFSLYHKLISLSIKYFSKVFKLLLNDYKGYLQIGATSYYKREIPFDGKFKFSEIDINDAKQFVKAMYFPPYNGAVFEKDTNEKIEINNINELVKYKDLFKQR
ncbi:MAG: formyltransferase family protein [Sulfurimonas sp.]|nr:formyltransferase family protein [Sulfurimonas sp.]